MEWKMQKRTVIQVMQLYHPVSYKGANRYLRYKNQNPCQLWEYELELFFGQGSFCIKYKCLKKLFAFYSYHVSEDREL